MFKRTKSLDEPFKRGQKVITTGPLGDFDAGTEGVVKLSNGLGVWRRYWVLFKDAELVGQIDHNSLVRPGQMKQWEDKQLEVAANAEAAASSEAATSGDSGGSSNSLGIPQALLDKSAAAKKRLLG